MFTPQETVTVLQVREYLEKFFSSDTDQWDFPLITVASSHTSVCYPPRSLARNRNLLINQMMKGLEGCSIHVKAVHRTKTSRYVRHYFELDGIAIEIAATKRGGLGVFFSSVRDMNDEIAKTVSYGQLTQAVDQLKKQALAKLTPQEKRALGF